MQRRLTIPDLQSKSGFRVQRAVECTSVLSYISLLSLKYNKNRNHAIPVTTPNNKLNQSVSKKYKHQDTPKS